MNYASEQPDPDYSAPEYWRRSAAIAEACAKVRLRSCGIPEFRLAVALLQGERGRFVPDRRNIYERLRDAWRVLFRREMWLPPRAP